LATEKLVKKLLMDAINHQQAEREAAREAHLMQSNREELQQAGNFLRDDT
jgi:hypothetical protein